MSEISKQALLVDNSQSFPNNNAGAITPANLRAFNVNMIDSLVDEIGYNVDSASWNTSINALNTFTSSQQPSFTALNSFTASQLTINSGVNLFTQSAGDSISRLSQATASLQNFTSSINQIIVNGSSIGTSTRLWFNGFVSASIVANVGGPIASITVLSDPSSVTTASFNAYTTSVNAELNGITASFNQFSSSQNSFNQSATASIQQLLGFSASLDTTYATDAQLNFSSSVLQNNINTVNGRVDTLSSFTGSYATTGSNTFVGNQTINGAVSVSSSATYDIDVTGSIQATTQIRVSGSSGIGNIGALLVSHTSPTSSIVSSLGKGFVTSTDSTGAPTTFKAIQISANPSVIGNATLTTTNPSIITPSSSVGGFITPIQFQDRSGYTDGRVTFTTPISASAGLVGNTRVTGSLTITGSALGNIVPLTISSETASMDLIQGNFFTLNLVSGSTTHLTATNIRPGQTVNLLLTQPAVGTGSVSYNSTFDFPAGANYIATPITSSKDIISLITFDSSTIYATSINNLG